MPTNKKLQYCLITTNDRGLYGGYLDYAKIKRTVERTGKAPDAVNTTEVRHCYSRPSTGAADDGNYTLATVGPLPGSKVGPALKEQIISNVANIVPVTPTARAAWKKATWR